MRIARKLTYSLIDSSLLHGDSFRYACILLVAGVGILGFRDPHGIRPLVYGAKKPTAEDPKTTHVLSSESVRISCLTYLIHPLFLFPVVLVCSLSRPLLFRIIYTCPYLPLSMINLLPLFLLPPSFCPPFSLSMKPIKLGGHRRTWRQVRA